MDITRTLWEALPPVNLRISQFQTHTQAFAYIAQSGAYFLSRLNHQTNIYEGTAIHLLPLDLAGFLQSVKADMVETQLFIGAQERLPSRLIASRVPEAIVNERRRVAR